LVYIHERLELNYMRIYAAIAVILLITASAFYYVQHSSVNQQPDTLIATSTAKTTEDVKVTNIDLVSPPSSWKSYLYDDYKISFPDIPQITYSEEEISDTNAKMQSVTYAALGSDHAGYFLTVTTIPNDVLIYDGRKLLENAVARSVRNVNGELAGAIDTRNSTGVNSIDFVINIPDGPRTYIARNVVEGNKLYEMRVVYLSSKSGEFRGFVDSLKLNQ